MESGKATFAADSVVLCGEGSGMKLLLVERKNAPYKGALALPGGLVEAGEDPWKAAVRELEEETGLILAFDEGMPLTPRSAVGRDPRGRVVSFPYLFWLREERAVVGKDDATRALWVPLKDLHSPLAFDHGAILCEALGTFWNFHHEQSPLWSCQQSYGAPERKLWERFKKEAEPEGIVFGGSFNPWHEGHALCARSGAERGLLVVVPNWNPFKQDGPHQCSFLRYQELKSKVEKIGGHVFPGLIGQERALPTYHWFPHELTACGKVKKYSMLMGEDSFAELPSWRHPERFLPRVGRIILVPRQSSDAEIDRTMKWLQQVRPEMVVEKLPGHPFQHLSSTEIRKSK